MVPQEEAGGQEGKGENLPGGPSMGRRAFRLGDGEKAWNPQRLLSCFCFSAGFNMDQCAMARALPLK
ncbi:MAG: hypothetical protein C6P37_14280 [Caldibacillus debilis]|uniref:Uncharacterized protein n=1 Tax=Caldibacillus debilis TaxID=301148 RepID=A0A3E0JZN6_9BACI|nr:MAG: hypothetical protein C6P37_14280 [Caldibacillus debilis]